VPSTSPGAPRGSSATKRYWLPHSANCGAANCGSASVSSTTAIAESVTPAAMKPCASAMRGAMAFTSARAQSRESASPVRPASVRILATASGPPARLIDAESPSWTRVPSKKIWLLAVDIPAYRLTRCE
jgi:hypothetical protein